MKWINESCLCKETLSMPKHSRCVISLTQVEVQSSQQPLTLGCLPAQEAWEI